MNKLFFNKVAGLGCSLQRAKMNSVIDIFAGYYKISKTLYDQNSFYWMHSLLLLESQLNKYT